MKNLLEVISQVKAPSTSGSVIRAHRRNWKITLKELGEMTEIAESNLSLIENDKVEIGTRRASLIGAALGIDPAFILFPEGAAGTFKKEVARVSKKASKLLAEKRKKYAA
ncbi:helix-turn-helix transcriptional regulator [Bdellovibrionota bacterium FG-1]